MERRCAACLAIAAIFVYEMPGTLVAVSLPVRPTSGVKFVVG